MTYNGRMIIKENGQNDGRFITGLQKGRDFFEFVIGVG